MPSFWQVFINPSMTSRAWRPSALMVPAEIRRLVTQARRSFSEALVWRDLGALEHLQQFALSSVQAGQQLTQLLVTGALPEDVVETLSEDGPSHRGRLLLPELQIAVEGPDLVPDLFQLARLLRRFRHQLLQQPLGMHQHRP